MAEETPQPSPPAAGGGLKVALIAIIAVLVTGIGVAYVLLKPPPPVVNESVIWPAESEKALQLTATLADGSFHLLADLRIRTAPVDVSATAPKVVEEFEGKRSVILDVLTTVGNSLDQSSVHKAPEFKTRLKRRLGEELQTAEIQDILIENWMVNRAE